MKMEIKAKIALAFALMLSVCAIDLYGESATGTTATRIAVTDCSGVVRTVDSVTLTYNPGWTWVTNTPGAYVVLEKTLRPKTARVGVPQAVTTTVQTFAADASGEYVFTPAFDDERCAVFTHRVYSGGGAELGTALTAEVSVGVRSAAAAGVFYDDATNAMQKVVDARGIAPIAHSVAWVTNAASFTITDDSTNICQGVAYPSTSTLLTGDDEGLLAYPSASFPFGEHVLSIVFADANGDAIPDATRMVRFEVPFKGGFIFLVR